MLTVRGLQVVKTNMVTDRMQKVAGSWIADSVFGHRCPKIDQLHTGRWCL